MLHIQIDTITYSGTAQRQIFEDDIDYARELAKDMTRQHSPYEFVTVTIQERNGSTTGSTTTHKFTRKTGWTSTTN